MNLKLILFFALITIVSAVKVSYEGYTLYQVKPKSDSDVKYLKEFKNQHLFQYLVSRGFIINEEVSAMVPPDNKSEFLQYLKDGNIDYRVVIADIQKAIEAQINPPTTRNTDAYLSYSWSAYQDLDTINKWLDELQENHPNVVKTVVMGKSVEDRDIKGIIINFHPDRPNPLYGIIESTLHAREWITPATVTWIIKEFMTSSDPGIRALAENFEWHIFPVVNPDGYAYTFTDNRMWRKNRSPVNRTTCAAGDDMSNGVDLNRNFDFVWNTVGVSPDPCSNTFPGPSAFSEPESRAIADYVLNLRAKGEIIYYLAFHSYTQLIVIPYSHLSNADALQSGNYADMYEIAIRGADALKKRYGTTYRVGLSADILYPMSGTSFDWVKHAANVPISFLIELRDLGEYGFLLPADQIIPTSLETMDALVEMDRHTRRLGYYHIRSGANGVFGSVVITLIGLFMKLFI